MLIRARPSRGRSGHDKMQEETTMRRNGAALKDFRWECVLVALVVMSTVPQSTSGAERMVLAEEFTNVG